MAEKKRGRKSEYKGALYVRMDAETERALREVVKLSERNQSDALRWSIRQMARQLKGETVSYMQAARV
jgi:predicted transcriptional regulator